MEIVVAAHLKGVQMPFDRAFIWILVLCNIRKPRPVRTPGVVVDAVGNGGNLFGLAAVHAQNEYLRLLVSLTFALARRQERNARSVGRPQGRRNALPLVRQCADCVRADIHQHQLRDAPVFLEILAAAHYQNARAVGRYLRLAQPDDLTNRVPIQRFSRGGQRRRQKSKYDQRKTFHHAFLVTPLKRPSHLRAAANHPRQVPARWHRIAAGPARWPARCSNADPAAKRARRARARAGGRRFVRA